jgi:hypothetical protein
MQRRTKKTQATTIFSSRAPADPQATSDAFFTRVTFARSLRLASARPSPCRVASAGGSEIPPVRFTRNAPLARLMILFAFAVLVRRCPPHPGTDPKLYQARGGLRACARARAPGAPMPREAW